MVPPTAVKPGHATRTGELPALWANAVGWRDGTRRTAVVWDAGLADGARGGCVDRVCALSHLGRALCGGRVSDGTTARRGFAPQQVDQFIANVVAPIRKHYKDQLAAQAELRV